MSFQEYYMSGEECRAFRAYIIVPDPACVEGQGNRDATALRKMHERLEAMIPLSSFHGAQKAEREKALSGLPPERSDSPKSYLRSTNFVKIL